MKATITLLLVLFTSIATFGQTTETRYYNGKYTKETALKKVNEYLKITQSDGRLKFGGGASSTYQINGIWELKINEKDKIVVGVRYLIEDKSLSISIVSVIVHKDGGLITLSPKSTNEAIREAYDNQVNLFTKVPFDYLMINENTTNPIANTTTTTGSNTSEQTTETRYFNGKYTKETALKKANDFFNLKNGEKITFTKMDKKSDYQFIGNWIIKSEAENLQSKIEYLFEDDGLKIKINEIVLNDKYGALKMDKNHKDEALRKTAEQLYASINDLFVKAVFVYLDINNNITPTTTTTTTAKSTSANNDNPYSGMSTEAKAYMETYKTNPNGLKNYLQNLHESWEEKGSSTSDINTKYIDMYQELYAKDKASAFELLMKLPFKWKEPHLKTITSFLTDEQKAYNRQKAQEVQKKYSN